MATANWRTCSRDAMQKFVADNPRWRFRERTRLMQGAEVLCVLLTGPKVQIGWYFFLDGQMSFWAFRRGWLWGGREIDTDAVKNRVFDSWSRSQAPRELDMESFIAPESQRNVQSLCAVISSVTSELCGVDRD